MEETSVYQAVDEEELEDVQQHSPQGDLQRPQVRVGREQRDEAQRAENVGDGKHGLGHQSRVPHLPLVPGFAAVVLRRTTDRERGWSRLPPHPGRTPYLGVGYDLERDGGQVQGIHDEVHQVPPVVDVVLETTVPHLFNLSPDEA